jgi:hypothetical protein
MTTPGFPFLGVKEGFPGSNMLQSSVKTAYNNDNRATGKINKAHDSPDIYIYNRPISAINAIWTQPAA